MDGSNLTSRLAERIQHKLALKGQGANSLELALRQAFKFYDMNELGYLSFRSFCAAIERVGVWLDSRDQAALKDQFDRGEQNKVYYHDFIAAIAAAARDAFRESQATSQTADDKTVVPTAERKKQTDFLAARLNKHCLLSAFSAVVKLDPGATGLADFAAISRALAGLTGVNFDAPLTAVLDGLRSKTPGMFDYGAFFETVLNPMSKDRLDLAARLFSQLGDGGDSVSPESLRAALRPESHPDLQRGVKSPKQVDEELSQGLESLLRYNRARLVTRKMFGDYVRFLSSPVESDSYFQLVLESVFGRKIAPRGVPEIRPEPNSAPAFAPAPETLSVYERGGKSQAVELALLKLSGEFKLKGLGFLLSFLRILKSSEHPQTKRISAAAFFAALTGCKFPLGQADQDALFRFFRRPGEDYFDAELFGEQLAPPLSARRQAQVARLFATFEGAEKGKVRLAGAKHDYNPTPAVLLGSGGQLALPSKLEFENALDNYLFVQRNQSEFITRAEFLDFYRHVGLFFPADDDFELALRQSWKKLAEKPADPQTVGRLAQGSTNGCNPPFGVNKEPEGDLKSVGKSVNKARISEGLQQNGFVAGTSSAQLNQNRQKQNRFQPDLPEQAPSERKPEVARPQPAPAEAPVEQPVGRLAELLAELNDFGVFQFIHTAAQNDPKDSGALTRQGLGACVKAALRLRENAEGLTDALFAQFPAKDAKATYLGIVKALALRSEGLEFSKLVKRAFKTLDLFRREAVSVDVVKNRFNPKWHPKVVRGRVQDFQLFQDFEFGLNAFVKFKAR